MAQKEVKDQKTIIVLGMHRSGTSLVAGILHNLGVKMGNNFLSPDRFNPEGYFEDTDFLSLDERILTSVDGDWDKPPQDINFAIEKKLYLEIKELISRKSEAKLWGWKDPRTVLTYHLYSPYLTNPYFVVCLRNPYDVAESLRERDGFSILDGLKLTNIYFERILHILEVYNSVPVLFISLEQLISNSVLQARRVADFVGVPFTDNNIEKIKVFIRPRKEIIEERLRTQREEEVKLREQIRVLQLHIRHICNSRGWKIISFLHRIRRSVPILRNL